MRWNCWPTPPRLACLDGIDVWYPTINADGSVRDGAWVAEATGLLDLSAWPRREQGDPAEGMTTPRRAVDVPGRRRAPDHRVHHRHPAGVVPGQLAGLDLRHRQHARVEERIRQAKATGMRNFPCNGFAANSAWLEIVMTAAMDLVAWSKSVSYTHLTLPTKRI